MADAHPFPKKVGRFMVDELEPSADGIPSAARRARAPPTFAISGNDVLFIKLACNVGDKCW